MHFSKVWKLAIGFVVLLVLWTFSWTSGWSADSIANHEPIEFEYMTAGAGGQYMTEPESYKMTQKCYGFEGQCEFEDLNLKLTLQFQGFKISKPFYSLGFFGGSTGWRLQTYFFGSRILTVSTRDGKTLGIFKQTLWNESAYSDFSQILFFDLGKRQVLISARDAFLAVRELGFVVQY